MKIAFVCVNYNNWKVSMEYINSVLTLKQSHELKIIVVDNASESDDITKLIASTATIPEVFLIKSLTNTGYFGGLNQGVSYAIGDGFNEYQIIGNNDIIFPPDFLHELQNLIIKRDELVISPDVITKDGIHENPHIITRVSKKRKLMYDIYYSHYFFASIVKFFYSDERKPKPVDLERKHIYMGIGALYVLTPFFFQHFKKLREEVFLYGEEAIFGDQIAGVGGKILYEPKLKCFHQESATTSRLGSRKKFEIVRKSYKIYKKYL